MSIKESTEWDMNDFSNVLKQFGLQLSQNSAKQLYNRFIFTGKNKISGEDLARCFALNSSLNGAQIKDYFNDQMKGLIRVLKERK